MMNREASNEPRAGIYLVGAIVTLAILIPIWTAFVMTVIEPETLTVGEQTMKNRLLWWVLGPTILVATLFGGYWINASESKRTVQRSESLRTQATSQSEQQKHEYVLEVIGLGVTLDKYRQGKLWDALQAGSPHATIRELDPSKYPWSELDKVGLSGERGGDALENGASFTPMYFAVPVFNGEAESHNELRRDSAELPLSGLAGDAIPSGMAWHLFVVGPRRFGEQPDRILEDVFAFFDAYPDVPYIVLNSEDSLGSRDSNQPNDAPRLLKDGNYVTEKPDASALFVLARRERVDPVRPFVWDDPDNDFVQNELRWMYGNLMIAVPNWQRKHALQTPTQVGSNMNRQEIYGEGHRQPLVGEWLEAATAFSQRPDLRGIGISGMLSTVNPFKHYPPKEWKPTPWFPIPWNREQLATFDRLPTLGYLHRPVFVKFTDEYGKLVTRRAERQKLLQAGWQAALQNLPEARRKDAPARVIAATGGKAAQLIAMHGVLDAQAAAGGPETDTGKSSQFIDTDKRLGDTGAATLFVQMAIGVMGSYRDGGVSAAVNLRSEDEASIVLISPPSDDQRKNQRHPRGGDVFAHRGTPAIDPGSYQ